MEDCRKIRSMQKGTDPIMGLDNLSQRVDLADTGKLPKDLEEP